MMNLLGPRPPDTHTDFNQLSMPISELTTTGPQQTRKPAPSRQPDYDSRSLLDPRAVATSQDGAKNNSQFNSTSDAAEDTRYSTARMIEDLHGVQERDAPMMKRKAVATDGDGSDEERKKQKTIRANKGGLISDHLEQERRNIGASAIDLTNDDADDEVIEQGVSVVTTSKTFEDEEVCLGVFDTTVNAHRVPSVSSASGIPKSHWPNSRITYKRDDPKTKIIHLIDNAGARFGSMDMRAAVALSPLMDGENVNHMRCRMYLLNRPKKPNESSGMRVRVDIEKPRALTTADQLFPDIPITQDYGDYVLSTQAGYQDRHVAIATPALSTRTSRLHRQRGRQPSTSGKLRSGRQGWWVSASEDVRSEPCTPYD